MSTFKMETFHNEYLAQGATSVDAILTVTASGTGTASAASAVEGPEAAEIIILDISGSMGGRTQKLKEAKIAAEAALDAMRDGVLFGIVAGNEEGYRVYPTSGNTLVPMSDVARNDARLALSVLTAGGGTAIGTWLRAANQMFPADAGMIRHAILLTDGENQNETADELDNAISQCEGRFQCDCRGVGKDWVVDELREISSRLLGTVDMIARPEEMEGDFRSMMEQSMGKGIADVRLRVWTPADATVGYVGLVHPQLEDLTSKRVVESEQVGLYPTGAWGDEARDYHVNVRFPARDVNKEMRAAKVELVVDDAVVTGTNVSVTWTNDLALHTDVVPQVERYVAQEESSRLTREGLEAIMDGDIDLATDKLAQGLAKAEEAGNEAQAERIRGLFETGPDGTMRLKRDQDQEDLMQTDLGTGKTERVHPETAALPRADEPEEPDEP